MYIDIVYETENAVFKFLLPDVKDRLNYYHKGARITIVGTLDQNRWISNEVIQKSSFQILVNTIEFIKINGRNPE